MNGKRIGLVGFDRWTCKGFENAGLNIISHIYANPLDKSEGYQNQPYLINFHDWKRYKFNKYILSSDRFSLMEGVRELCFQDFIRCTDRWDWSRELVHNWSDYDHLFALAFDHAYYWLTHYKIDTLIYSNVPHQGMALVQYSLAKMLNINTLVFLQSPIESKSWLVEHWSDLGTFQTSPKSERFDIDISEPENPPFYMSNVNPNIVRKLKVVGHKLRARTIVALGMTGLTSRVRRRNFQRNMNRWQRAVEDERYLTFSEEFFKDKAINEPFVYFPLHLQPEMTTDILGGRYADQALTLETLRSKIPNNVAIYVKENPKQIGRLRSEAFFERISKVPNTKFMSRHTSSFDLIRNSIAVATISGTAGWEALRMGKAAIVFGDAFWKNLPGAFPIDPDFDWLEITDFEFDRKTLKEAAMHLSQYLHQGVCDPIYSQLVPNFNPKKNSQDLAKTIITKLAA
ncbi:MAG: hypothetical protein AAF217_06180 [Pseudomonadota bacterium]